MAYTLLHRALRPFVPSPLRRKIAIMQDRLGDMHFSFRSCRRSLFLATQVVHPFVRA